MLTHINRLMRTNRAFTTTELAMTCILVASAFAAIKVFGERTLKDKVHAAAVWSNAHDGLDGTNDDTGWNEQYTNRNTNENTNSNQSLIVATDSMTETQGGGTTTTGNESTDGVSN